MLSITVGPLSLPLRPFTLLLSIWLAAWLAGRLARRAGGDRARAESALFHVAGAALVAARLAHLAQQADLYAAAPLAMLDLRDGGWHWPTGLVAGLGTLGVTMLRQPALRRSLGLGALAGAAAWGGVLAWQLHGSPPTLPDLALTPLPPPTGLAGQAVTLRARALGQPTVVNLWATWCGPCRQEMPLLAAAQQREHARGPAGVRILFVNQGESASAVQAYLTDQGLSLQDAWLDPSARAGPAFGSRGLPTTLFLDAEGRQVAAHVGVLSAPALEARLRALRDLHRPPFTTNTPRSTSP